MSFDSIEWSNHLDLDPELLYEKSEPAIEYFEAVGNHERGFIDQKESIIR